MSSAVCFLVLGPIGFILLYGALSELLLDLSFSRALVLFVVAAAAWSVIGFALSRLTHRYVPVREDEP